MIGLENQAIVWTKDALDPNGNNPKNRPAVVMSKDCSGSSVFLVFITGEFDEPLPPEQVQMRWRRDGHPITGLYKECVALTTWFDPSFDLSRILKRAGYCPDQQFAQILLMLQKRLEQKRAKRSDQ